MNGASVAYGLRAALSNHEGTALHRFAVEALDMLARCAPEIRPNAVRGVTADVVEQAQAFAAGWVGYPDHGPADVMSPRPSMVDDVQPRFYWVEAHRPDYPEHGSLLDYALRLVPEGHAVVAHETGEIRHHVSSENPLGTAWEPVARVWVDRRPPGRILATQERPR